MPAVMLQQQREPQSGGTSLADQQLPVLIKQGPELDQLVDITWDLIHGRSSFLAAAVASSRPEIHWGW